ncbi:HEAT repeat protein [Silvibacterium bohemicum]|uniref:HEAT repeat protein n=1 Tax=Silvibacterium bohemicum TaxID=1577686 RepID=A0A841K2W4_9BACT|nr:HEAT repeat domain-containing protein [Silvibacterium bohemicum]MBB6144594.1 HEAT repeat protein [Silvibacterium bohemicum]
MKNFAQTVIFSAILLSAVPVVQAQSDSSSNNNQAAQASQGSDEPDQPVTAHSDQLKSNQGDALTTAWQMLQSTSQASKPREHVSLLVALGTLGGYKQAEEMITSAMKDNNLDVKLAAVASAGTTEDHAFIPALRIAMEYQAPEVVVTAAASLWKMGDHTGMNVLQGVLTGQMKATSGMLKSGMHTVNRDLHDPSTMATMGAEEGASMLFGPVGIALAAVKFAHPGPSANSPRVIAAGLLASDPNESNQKALIQTLRDKDPFLRLASAKALGKFHGKDVTDALVDGFDDPKPSVRYMSAASYIRVTTPLTPEEVHQTTHKTSKKKPVAKQN